MKTLRPSVATSWHHRLPMLAVVVWLALLTIAVIATSIVSFNSFMWNRQGTLNAFARSASFYELSRGYDTPLVDQAAKRFVLPDAKVSIAYDASLGDLRYAYSEPNNVGGSYITLTTDATLHTVSDQVGNAYDFANYRKSYNQAANSDRYPFQCQEVARLTQRVPDDTAKVARTVQLADRTWYIDTVSPSWCSEFRSEGEQTRIVELLKTAQDAAL